MAHGMTPRDADELSSPSIVYVLPAQVTFTCVRDSMEVFLLTQGGRTLEQFGSRNGECTSNQNNRNVF